MADSRFVYVTYIRTTPEKLWQALIEPEFTRQFWVRNLARLRMEARRIVEADDSRRSRCRQRRDPGNRARRRLVLKWRNEFKPELRAEGYSRLTYELEKQGESVKLTLIHEIDKPDSKLIEAVSSGWPHILASLKSLLETGESLEETRRWPKGM